MRCNAVGAVEESGHVVRTGLDGLVELVRKDLALFINAARIPRPRTAADVPTHVILPAFVLSEIKTAFQMGFLIFLPMLVIDMVVAVAVGLLAKAVPQINLMIVGYPVKVFIGLTVLAATFPLLFPIVGDAFQRLQMQLVNLVNAF